MANRLVSAVKGTGRVLAETFRLGGRAWIAAPAIVAIAVVPEFAQHVAEIKLGMFDSAARFTALGNHPTRWVFGYAKVAGMIVALLAIARFWAVGSVRKTFLIPLADLLRLVLAIALTVVASLPFDWVTKQDIPTVATYAARFVSFLIQAGLSLYVAAALFGDRSLTLKTAFTERWPTALLLAFAALCAFLPLQLLHMLNHKLALGRSDAIVWVLMIWDSLVVGLIATTVGSALWASYRSGASWRGWGPDFRTADEAPADDHAISVTPSATEAPTKPEPEAAAEAPRRRPQRPRRR